MIPVLTGFSCYKGGNIDLVTRIKCITTGIFALCCGLGFLFMSIIGEGLFADQSMYSSKCFYLLYILIRFKHLNLIS